MAFSMNGARQANNAKEDKEEKKKKLLPGSYVCTVVDVKEVDSPMYGHGFVLEFVVDAGDFAGAQKDFQVFPDAPQKPSKMPVDKRRALDMGKIQNAVAACHGLPAARAFEIDDAKYAASIARPVSPLRGRKIVVESVPRTGADGKPDMKSPGYYYELFPATGDVSEVTQVRRTAPKAAPAVPAKPKPPTLEMAMKERGFEVHPDDSDFVFNSETGEVIEVSEFKLTYGI